MSKSLKKTPLFLLLPFCAPAISAGQNFDIWSPQGSPTYVDTSQAAFYWDSTATNWTVNGTPGQVFQNGDDVYLSDQLASGQLVGGVVSSPPVTYLTQSVDPGSITVFVSATNNSFAISSLGAAGSESIGDNNLASPTSLTQLGPGNLFFLEQNPTSETYTGPTTIYQGTFNLTIGEGIESFSNRFGTVSYGFHDPSVNLINPNSTLQMAGGELLVSYGPVDNSTGSQSFNHTLIESGASNVTGYIGLADGTAGNTTVSTNTNIGIIARNSGGTIDFEVGPNAYLADGAMAFTTLTTSNANVNGIVGGWATIATTDWASIASNGQVVTLTANGGYNADAWASGTNTDVLNNDVIPNNSLTNSVRFNANAGNNVSLGGANTISSGGILMTANVGAYNSTLTGGFLTSGNGQDLIIFQYNTQGLLTIGSTLTDNGATSIGLTKSGAGTAVLSGVNTYTGVTTINGGNTAYHYVVVTSPNGTATDLINPQVTSGMLSVTHLADGGLPSSIGESSSDPANLILNGATLQYLGAGDSTDRLFTIGPNGATLDASGTGAILFTNTGSPVISQYEPTTFTLTGTSTSSNTLAMTLADPISTNVNLPVYKTSLVKTGTGTWVLSGSSTFTGGTNVNGGTLILANTAGYAAGPGEIDVNSGGTLINTGIGTESEAIDANNGGSFINNGSFSNMEAFAYSYTGGVVTNNGSIYVLMGAGGTTTNNGTAVYGEMLFGGTFTNSATGTLTAGMYAVNGTMINDGYSNSLSAANYDVGGNDATISGSGRFGDGSGFGRNIASAITIAPGDPAVPGTLTFDNLEMAQYNTLDYRLDHPGVSSSNDLLDITNNLTLDPTATFIFLITPGPDFTVGTYDLINFGSLTNESTLFADWSANLVGGNSDFNLALSLDTADNQLDLVVTYVPEPDLIGIALLGLVAGGSRRRRN
ncbi:MAG TPA: autotransporter-associated beta strand repeat-containing protein [Tepidisphaeraceae bacterium]|jgi:fibronectin-binding autotransporter adhesin